MSLPHFQFHIEVWVLIATLIVVGVYIGTKLAKQLNLSITKKQKTAFWLAVVSIWLASDWPLHDLSENYLYFMHVIQHLLIVFVAPPLLWIATPKWFANLVVGNHIISVENGSGQNENSKTGKSTASQLPRWLNFLGHPVMAGVMFNLMLAATHIPGVVNASTTNGPFHYFIHLALFLTAMIMWLPVVGPYSQLHLRAPGKMIYLFSMSLLPTIPAAFLTFASGPIYSAYAQDGRIWNLSAVSDQQAAGLIMKLIGGFYLWIIIAFIFFKWLKENSEMGDGLGSKKDATIVAEETMTHKETSQLASKPQPPHLSYEQGDVGHEQTRDRTLQR